MKTEQHLLTPKDAKDLPDFVLQFAPYWRAIVGVLVLVLLGIGGSAVISSSRKRSQEAGWTAYLNATANRDPVALQEVAKLGGSDVSAWALHAAAQAKLIEASTLVHTDRASARTGFQEAIDGFNQALERANSQTLIRQQTLWGLGQAHEGLNELAKAKEHYKQIQDKWPNSAIAKQAQERINRLNDPATQEFYNWFFAQEPPSRLPGSGEMQPFPFEVPSNPDFSVPDPPETGGGTSALPDGSDNLAGDALDPPADQLPGDDSSTDETSTTESDETEE